MKHWLKALMKVLGRRDGAEAWCVIASGPNASPDMLEWLSKPAA